MVLGNERGVFEVFRAIALENERGVYETCDLRIGILKNSTISWNCLPAISEIPSHQKSAPHAYVTRENIATFTFAGL